MKISKWTIFFIAVIASFMVALTAYAQETPEEVAKKYNVTFPIAELNNCANLSECRTFCEDPVNQNTCISYAKQKGFYKEPEVVSKKESILAAAKAQLGCDSESSCMAFCSDSANFDKCDAFAKSQGFSGGHIDDSSKLKVIAKAKEILGCDSPTACQSLCSQEENRQKCSEFAKSVGLRGGEQRVGPGGCTTEATCRAFCSDPANFEVCRGFSKSSGGQFSGPGGCNSEESCRAYCKDHEQECRSMGGSAGSPPPGYNPVEMCSRTPNCKWEENTCQCGFYGSTGEEGKRSEEYAKYCRENPSKCGPGQAGGFGSDKERGDFEDYCRQNPDKCRPPGDASPAPYSSPTSGGSYNYQSPPPGGYSTDPATGCAQAGCSWTGSSCQCGTSGTSGSSGSTSTPQPESNTSTPVPQETSAPQPAETSQPQTEEQSTPAPSPEVQGVTTVKGLLQILLDWLR